MESQEVERILEMVVHLFHAAQFGKHGGGEGIPKNHPFVDGNKRTAAITCELFLNLNGLLFTIPESEKYPHYLAFAVGEHSEESFTNWLRSVTAQG